jgi:hypothetical protein
MIVLLQFFDIVFLINMKKLITKILVLASLAILLDSFNFWANLVLFFFTGRIAGTDYILLPSTMLAIYSFLACILITGAFVIPYVKKHFSKNNKTQKLKTSAKLA